MSASRLFTIFLFTLSVVSLQILSLDSTNAKIANPSVVSRVTSNPAEAPSCSSELPGLISWWRGEGNPLDSAGPNHGTLQGNVGYATGKVGQAFKFQDYFQEKVYVDARVYEMSGGTTSLWFNWDGNQFVHGANVMIGSSLGGVKRSPLFGVDSGFLLWEFGSLTRMSTNTRVIPGRWYHAVLTYDSNFNIKVYVDGVLVSGGTSVNPEVFRDNMAFGNWNDVGTTAGFGGLVDEVQIYNRPLSDCEVANLYNSANGLPCAVCDGIAPTTSVLSGPTANAAGWNNSNVGITLSAIDDPAGSGIREITYSATGAQTIFSTTVSGPEANILITAEGETTINFFATDFAGNTETLQSLTVKIDKSAPTIALTTPSADAVYLLNQSVAANYSCGDSGSGIAGCVGSVANGSLLDTAATGADSFTVNATDIAGNSASTSVNYNVSFGIQVLFDQTRAHKSGSTIPIKIRLVDAAGANVSSASTVVHALTVVQTGTQASTAVEDSGNANPDLDFRFDASLGGYIFNLKTTDYGTGSYLLNFTVGNSATVYSVGFQVRH